MSLITLSWNLRLHYLLSLALALSACSSQLPRQAEVLRSGISCCSSLTELPLSGTLTETPLTADINDQTKIFDFPQGRSHFIAVRIPRTDAQRKLEVRTWHQGNSTYDQQIFCPVVTLLDRDKHVITTVELNNMDFTRAGFIDNARFTQVLAIPGGTEYAVLHTPSNSIGQELTARVDRRVAVIVLPSGAYVSKGNDAIGIPCGQQGKITMQLQ